jgi:hypothetical protein
MSRPLCSECGTEIPRNELVICDLCEHGFCCECGPDHSPCSQELRAEERVHCPEVSRS